MIQIFEIIQESSNGWWSDNKDTIAGFGVIASIFISGIGALISIRTLNLNKKTLIEIEKQRIESYKPDIFFENKYLSASNIDNFKFKSVNEKGEQINEEKNRINIKNIGLGVAKNIKIKVKLSLKKILDENIKLGSFEGKKNIDNSYEYIKNAEKQVILSDILEYPKEIGFIETTQSNIAPKNIHIHSAVLDKISLLISNLNIKNNLHNQELIKSKEIIWDDNYINIEFYDIGGLKFEYEYKITFSLNYNPNYISLSILFKKNNI